MVERSSRWLLQELFVDPTAPSLIDEGELYLKLSSEAEKKGENLISVVVELSGSVISGELQYANFRFVNLTLVEAPWRRKRKVLKLVEDRKKVELLSLLPMYLAKSGIVLKELACEL
jgi:hypothetical protein